MDEKDVNENLNETNENKEEVKNQKKKKTIFKEMSEKEQNFIFNIIAVIALILLSIAVTPKVLQNDTFYTVKVGEYISQNGIFNLNTDPFSWMDLPYTFPHWLYDLMMFKIYSIGGFDAIYVSSMFFISLLSLSIYAVCKEKTNKNYVVSAVLAMLAIYVLEPYIPARAQLVTFILFALTVLFIERLYRTNNKKYAIPLLIIPLLITNLHCAVYPFYFIVCLPYVAEYIVAIVAEKDLDKQVFKLVTKIQKKFSKKNKEKYDQRINILNDEIYRRKVRREEVRKNPYKIKIEKNPAAKTLIVIVLIAALLGFVNPCGTGAYTYIYKTYQGNTTQSINEHLPVTLIESRDFLVSLIVILCILMFTDTKIRLPDLFFFGGLTLLALKSRRQISFFYIFCIPIAAALIAAFLDKYDSKLCKIIKKYFTDFFGVIIFTCIILIISMNILKPKLHMEYISNGSYPVEAADWILENVDLSTAKFYNEYNYGSYLILRGIPVFIDSRCDLYTPQFNSDYDSEFAGKDIFSDALNIANQGADYNIKFEEYGITHAMLLSNAKVAEEMSKDTRYEKIYDDGTFVIFKRKAANVEKLKSELITEEKDGVSISNSAN